MKFTLGKQAIANIQFVKAAYPHEFIQVAISRQVSGFARWSVTLSRALSNSESLQYFLRSLAVDDDDTFFEPLLRFGEISSRNMILTISYKQRLNSQRCSFSK